MRRKEAAKKYPIAWPVAQLHRPAGTVRARPRSDGNYVQECNHVYAEAHGLGLVMDVFQPEGAGNGFGIVDVVSGGWFGDRVRLNEHIGLGLFDVLCGCGFTVFAVSPGSLPLFTGRDMVCHVHAALRYIKAQAAEFGVEPGRLGLTGASAGGHLAALAALDPQPGRARARDVFARQDSGVKAVALFFAPSDLMDYGGRVFEFVEMAGAGLDRLLFADGMAGRRAAEIEAGMEALSPARRVCGTPPPFLLVHGDADEIVPLEQSRKLARALEAAGGEAELVVKAGGGHPWPGIREELGYVGAWFEDRL